VLYRYYKIFATMREWTWSYFAYAQELAFTLVAGGALLLMTIKKQLVPRYYLSYAWLAYLVPPLTGTLQSMPRYIVGILPLVMLYGLFLEKIGKFRLLMLIASVVLLLVNLALFIQGYWVA